MTYSSLQEFKGTTVAELISFLQEYPAGFRLIRDRNWTLEAKAEGSCLMLSFYLPDE